MHPEKYLPGLNYRIVTPRNHLDASTEIPVIPYPIQIIIICLSLCGSGICSGIMFSGYKIIDCVFRRVFFIMRGICPEPGTGKRL